MHLRLDKGGEADVVAIEGERVTLVSTLPAPPGSPLGAVLNEGEGAGAPIRVKVHGCRREGAGFRIEGRVVDLTRGLRAALGALAEARASASGELAATPAPPTPRR